MIDSSPEPDTFENQCWFLMFCKNVQVRALSRETAPTLARLTCAIDRSAQHVIVRPDVLHAAVPHLVVLLVLGQEAVALGAWRRIGVGEAGRAARPVDQGVFLGHWQLVVLLGL